MSVRVSVVIPCLNEERHLPRALKALAAGQDLPDEIVVADGRSTDATADIARAFGARVVDNAKRHAAAGRNVAFAETTGDVVAFVDADCVPARDWCLRIRGSFEAENRLVALGGRMLALPPANRVEDYAGKVFLDEIMRFPDKPTWPSERSVQGAFITANCAYKSDALCELEGFSDWFGNHAEDIDLFWRAMEAYPNRLLYDPDLLVEHSFPDCARSLWKKYIQYGISSSKLSARYSSGWQVDWRLHRRIAYSLLHAVAGADAGRCRLQVVQLTAHAVGKAYGSVLTGARNF